MGFQNLQSKLTDHHGLGNRLASLFSDKAVYRCLPSILRECDANGVSRLFLLGASDWIDEKGGVEKAKSRWYHQRKKVIQLPSDPNEKGYRTSVCIDELLDVHRSLTGGAGTLLNILLDEDLLKPRRLLQVMVSYLDSDKRGQYRDQIGLSVRALIDKSEKREKVRASEWVQKHGGLEKLVSDLVRIEDFS